MIQKIKNGYSEFPIGQNTKTHFSMMNTKTNKWISFHQQSILNNKKVSIEGIIIAS